MTRQPIPLAEGRNATGGNLIPADGVLLIATTDKIYAFRNSSETKSTPRSP